MSGSPAPAAPYLLQASLEPPLLRVRVSGGEDTTLPVTLEYWLRIAAEVRRTGATQLLVLDAMQGEVMGDAELARFFQMLEGQGLLGVRIAYVEGRVDQIPRTEFVEQMALERGYDLRVFGDETSALFWLRHGAA